MAHTRPKVPTAINDVPTALTIHTPVLNIRPGTIRNSPPIPKYPEAKPTAIVVGIIFFAETLDDLIMFSGRIISINRN